MKGSVAISIGLHVAILAIALFGLPRPDPYKIKPQEAIQVDISHIGDVQKKMAMAKDATETKAKPAPKKTVKVAEADPAAKVAEEVKKAAKEPKAEPPPPEPKKEEPPKKAEEPKPLDPDPLKALIKDTVADTPEPKPEPPKKAEAKPVKKPDKKPDKKKEKLDVDQLEAFLNKVDDDKTSPAETSSVDGAPAKGEVNLQGTDDQLVGTIVDALVSKVRQCWNVPPGAREANLTIRVHFALNADGTIAGTPQVENASADPVFDATARSAVAALMQCQAYELPQDRYDLWKDNTLDFNPNLMFQG